MDQMWSVREREEGEGRGDRGDRDKTQRKGTTLGSCHCLLGLKSQTGGESSETEPGGFCNQTACVQVHSPPPPHSPAMALLASAASSEHWPRGIHSDLSALGLFTSKTC